MIVATETTVKFIEAQESLDTLAKDFGVTKQTLFNIKTRERVSSEMIEKIMTHTGFSFDKAFEIVK